MQINASTPDEYVSLVPEESKDAIKQIREVILANLPAGFEETMSYGMIGYVVPHSLYPPGYHCNTKLPLPMMHLAAQKNFVTVYHLGIYANPELASWFMEAYSRYSKTKPNIGKGCIRFKPNAQIPIALLGELAAKVSVQAYVQFYEKLLKK